MQQAGSMLSLDLPSQGFVPLDMVAPDEAVGPSLLLSLAQSTCGMLLPQL